ncbi:MAG: hypothetical protein RLZ98_3521 [Pseudomonadota bacterium]|jgi:hypothetical protein
MADVLSAFDELTATTAKHRQRRITNSVAAHNAHLRMMEKRGNIQIAGGSEIVEPVGLVENGTITNIAGAQTASTAYEDNITACRVPWVSKWMAVSAPGDLLRKNNGADAFVKLVNAKVDIAEQSAANFMNAEVCGDGSGDQAIFGLQLWLQSDGLGIAGGLDAATYSNWANKVQSLSGSAFSDATGATMRADFNKLYIKCVFDMEKPDTCMATHDIYNVYEAAVQQQMRYPMYGDKGQAETGVDSVYYKSMMVTHDVNANFAATGQRAYFLNSKHCYLFEHPQARWEKEDARRPTNADVIIIPFLWMGNYLKKSRRTQGLLKAA